MVESTAAYTGYSQNEVFESLVQCDGDLSRASEKAHKCVISRRMAALAEDDKLAETYINVETERG